MLSLEWRGRSLSLDGAIAAFGNFESGSESLMRIWSWDDKDEAEDVDDVEGADECFGLEVALIS